jgi:hypothetical protein
MGEVGKNLGDGPAPWVWMASMTSALGALVLMCTGGPDWAAVPLCVAAIVGWLVWFKLYGKGQS